MPSSYICSTIASGYSSVCSSLVAHVAVQIYLDVFDDQLFQDERTLPWGRR
jgi:hypothetical protein